MTDKTIIITLLSLTNTIALSLMGGHINIVVSVKTLITTYEAFVQRPRYIKDKPANIAIQFKYGKPAL